MKETGSFALNLIPILINNYIMKEDAIRVALDLLYLLGVMEFPEETIQSAINICKKYKVNIKEKLNLTDDDYEDQIGRFIK